MILKSTLLIQIESLLNKFIENGSSYLAARII